MTEIPVIPMTHRQAANASILVLAMTMLETDPIMQELTARFRLRSAEDRARLFELEAQVPSVGQAALDEIRALAHRLSGSSGTFGYPELSCSARILDDLLTAGSVQEQDLRQSIAAVARDIDALA